VSGRPRKSSRRSPRAYAVRIRASAPAPKRVAIAGRDHRGQPQRNRRERSHARKRYGVERDLVVGRVPLEEEELGPTPDDEREHRGRGGDERVTQHVSSQLERRPRDRRNRGQCTAGIGPGPEQVQHGSCRLDCEHADDPAAEPQHHDGCRRRNRSGHQADDRGSAPALCADEHGARDRVQDADGPRDRGQQPGGTGIRSRRGSADEDAASGECADTEHAPGPADECA